MYIFYYWGGNKILNILTSSTRTRRGGSCLKDIYKTFLIYRTCMRRAPAKPVRVCTLRKLRPASHVICEAPLRISHSTLHTALFALHTSHFTLHSSHSKLHTPHFTLLTSHSALHTPHFTLHASYFSQLSSDSALHTSHFTCHNPHFTLLIAFFTLPTLLHSTEKLLHTASFHTQQAFTHRTLTHSAFTHGKRLHTHTQKLLHREAFTHSKLLHTKLLHTASFHTQQAFTHNTCTQCFYTWQAFTHRTLTHNAFTHGKRLHTHIKKTLLHRDTFKTCTDKLLHTANFYTQDLLHTASYARRKRLDTEHLHTILAHSAFTHGKRLHTNFSIQELQLQNDFEALFKRDFKRKITSAKMEKIC